MIRPLGDKVVVEPKDDAAKTAGGIFLPDTAKKKPQEGVVIAVGPGRILDDGTNAKMNVKAGDVVGLGGSTGRSTGPHLHFEVRFQYEPFDPEWILDFSNYTLRTRKLYLDKTYFGIRKPSKGEALVYKADKSIVPEEVSAPKGGGKPVYATMKKGENLDDLAKRNYTTADKLRELNPDVSKFKSGMRIRVR